MLNAFDKYVVAIKIHKTNNKVILSFYCCSSCAWDVLGTSCKMLKCNVCMYVCKFVNCYFVNTSKSTAPLRRVIFCLKYILIGLRVIFHGWHSHLHYDVEHRSRFVEIRLSRSITINMCTNYVTSFRNNKMVGCSKWFYYFISASL